MLWRNSLSYSDACRIGLTTPMCSERFMRPQDGLPERFGTARRGWSHPVQAICRMLSVSRSRIASMASDDTRGSRDSSTTWFTLRSAAALSAGVVNG